MAEPLRPTPDVKYLRPDAKGRVSEIFGRLKYTTANNFPEPKFRASIINGESVIFFEEYGSYRGTDGGGTRDELFERRHEEFGDPRELRTSARGAVAMIEGDAARKGGFLVGLDNTIDVNSAGNSEAMKELSIGLEESVREVGCAITSGEVAELGYRTGGYGKLHFNWNMSGTVLDVPEKRLEAKNLMPGQILVAFREESLRANGYTDARKAMQDFYLLTGGIQALASLHFEYFLQLRQEYGMGSMEEPGSDISRMAHNWATSMITPAFNEERHLLPWHVAYPEILQQLTMPPKFYSPIMYDAQGGVYGERKVDMVAAVHITGGGIPLKGIRMVYSRGLGLAVDHVFPDPVALTSMVALAEQLGGHPTFTDDRHVCDTWNRGIGFITVVRNTEEAKKLINIAGNHECEAAIAGEVLDKPEVQFKNHIWSYSPELSCP